MSLAAPSRLPSYAPLESARFGMKVFRGTLEGINSQSIRQFSLDKGADLLILRTPGDGQEFALQLEGLGFPYYHADVLVYYEADLTSFVNRPLRNPDLIFELCGPEHIPILSDLVRTIFANYRNHYMANPLLERRLVTEGLQEWATSFAHGKDPSRCAWVVRRGNTWVAFAACSQLGDECEGILYGVHPNHEAMGIYSDLIRFTIEHYKTRGCRRMKVSTQIHNLAVQRVWNREGFTISSIYNTWHINTMLTFSSRNIINHQFQINPEDIQQLSLCSGNLNFFGSDDTFAKQSNFSKEIAPKFFANSMISRAIEMEFPSQEIIIKGYSCIYLQPLLLNQDYQMSIRTLRALPSGHWKYMARVNDIAQNPTILSYIDLLVKSPR